MSKILIVEDDILIVKAMEEILKSYNIFHAYDGKSALDMINTNHFDLILLDLMLPKLNGIEILKKITIDNFPCIIAITAKTDLNSEIECYKLGIRNYIQKPIDSIKLKTIVDSILNPSTYTNIFKYKNIIIDLIKKQISINNIVINLTPKEYELFYFLYKNKGQTISRNQILDEIWGFDCFVDTRVIDVNIQKLRKKLNLKNEIITVSKVGYRLENYNET